uniref:Golgi transport 1A n=1 Tax=Cyprinus carpio carpio TaxID=630221 RepID=A0A8C1A395_CYPCA
MITITEFQKIGVGLSGFGVFFVLFGILLYFDSVLLAFGNILFVSGLAFIIGLRRTAHFFFQRQKLRSSAAFLGGVALVLLRWPRIGMLVETYVKIYKGFVVRNVPVKGMGGGPTPEQKHKIREKQGRVLEGCNPLRRQ